MVEDEVVLRVGVRPDGQVVVLYNDNLTEKGKHAIVNAVLATFKIHSLDFMPLELGGHKEGTLEELLEH